MKYNCSFSFVDSSLVVRSFVGRSLVRWSLFVRLLVVHSVVPSFVRCVVVRWSLSVRLFVRLFVRSFVRLFVCSFVCSFVGCGLWFMVRSFVSSFGEHTCI